MSNLDTTRGGRLSIPLLAVSSAAAFVVLVGLVAVVIPRTETARDEARAEQFHQLIVEIANDQMQRLSLRR